MVAELQAAPREWTYDELPPWDGATRYEIYDGELYIMPSPSLWHQELILRLTILLQLFIREHDLGKLYLSPCDMVVAPRRSYIPDMMFVSKTRLESERIEREDGQCLIGLPDLALEIVSPASGRNDMVRKMRAYAEFGVRHNWIVNPEMQVLQAFTLDGGTFHLEFAGEPNDTFAPSLFPGLQIALSELFAQ